LDVVVTPPKPDVPNSNLRKRPKSWPYRADPPQRYWVNYERYQRRGGLIDLEKDIAGFAADGNTGDISRFYFFCLAFDQIVKEGIQGDLAELGVYRGHTATLLAQTARRLGRTAFLLDTFEGFNTADLSGIDAGQKMQFADTSLEAVRATVGESNVQYVKGYFPETAAQLPETTYCLVHIDCDLYAPIMSALAYFYPRLEPGGFLIIHDYSSLAWDGAERAVDEFFADKPEPIVPLTDGAGSIVIRRARGHIGTSAVGWLDQKRIRLFSDDWSPAGKGHLTECLREGWGGQEDWGVWGVGPKHELKLYLADRPEEDFLLDVDVHGPALDAVGEHHVDVYVKGNLLGTIDFDTDTNRGVRSIRISRDMIAAGPVPSVIVEFRPHRTVRPIDLNPATGDIRELGLALHRIRRRSV
jgi:hypothetical protein